MKKKLLLKLADELENMEKNKKLIFDMDTWHKKEECGTTCCAWGLALELNLVPKEYCSPNHIKTGFIPKGSTQVEQYISIAKCFGLTPRESLEIFDPNSYNLWSNAIEPELVATTIREVVAAN